MSNSRRPPQSLKWMLVVGGPGFLNPNLPISPLQSRTPVNPWAAPACRQAYVDTFTPNPQRLQNDPIYRMRTNLMRSKSFADRQPTSSLLAKDLVANFRQRPRLNPIELRKYLLKSPAWAPLQLSETQVAKLALWFGMQPKFPDAVTIEKRLKADLLKPWSEDGHAPGLKGDKHESLAEQWDFYKNAFANWRDPKGVTKVSERPQVSLTARRVLEQGTTVVFRLKDGTLVHAIDYVPTRAFTHSKLLGAPPAFYVLDNGSFISAKTVEAQMLSLEYPVPGDHPRYVFPKDSKVEKIKVDVRESPMLDDRVWVDRFFSLQYGILKALDGVMPDSIPLLGHKVSVRKASLKKGSGAINKLYSAVSVLDAGITTFVNRSPGGDTWDAGSYAFGRSVIQGLYQLLTIYVAPNTISRASGEAAEHAFERLQTLRKQGRLPDILLRSLVVLEKYSSKLPGPEAKALAKAVGGVTGMLVGWPVTDRVAVEITSAVDYYTDLSRGAANLVASQAGQRTGAAPRPGQPDDIDLTLRDLIQAFASGSQRLVWNPSTQQYAWVSGN